MFLGEMSGLKKEDVRSMEGEKDKDIDSVSAKANTDIAPVDIPAVRRAFSALFKLEKHHFEGPLVNALVTLAGNLQMELPVRRENESQDDIVNVLVIVFEIPVLGEYF